MKPINHACLLLLCAITFTIVSAEEKPIATPKAQPSEVVQSASGAVRTNVVPLGAQEFPLSAVKLLDSPFRRAMETDKAYLLRLEPDRFLAGFRREAGLPKKADPYGGWETIPEKGRYSLAGQALGHYLSALSLMTSATGDVECRRRIEYIVQELSECQKTAGTGILCAFPESKQIFAELAAGQIKSDHLFGLNGGYVPLYVTHKVMAGLRDAWMLLGNQEARDVLIRMADWLDTVFKDLTDAQIRELLETEHGGIMELVADVYAITGDNRYLALAKRLNHQSLFEPMTRGEDVLTGQHANAQIPKVIGMERIYQLTGEQAFGKAARFFWDNVVHTRSFVIGGHGENEFFFDPDAFATKGVISETGPETCNTYNMIKLSRRLWLVNPSVDIADFIERALYNHILPSQEPEHSGFVYFTSMRPGHYRTYSSETEDFWCCTDTGMENHAKYGEFIYAHSGNRLWVDLLIPSELNWAEQGMTLRLDTHFPEDGKATLSFSAKEPRKLAIAIRCPIWLESGAMKVAVNGVREPVEAKPGSYAVVERTWKTGDKLELEWPLKVRTEMLPRSKEWISVLWGPVVLAGELGIEELEGLDFSRTHSYAAPNPRPVEKAPAFIGSADDVLAKVKPVEGKPLAFRTVGLGSPADVSLAPFYRVHRQRYAIYWKLMASAVITEPWKPATGPLMTRWAKEVTPASVLPEYPRPQMVRRDWLNLNGLWQLEFGNEEDQAPLGKTLSKQILVPFPVESALSGVMQKADRLWYRRTFQVPSSWQGQRVLLHFGAVDWEAAVFINGKEIGTHRGGYDPFSFDITDMLTPTGDQELIVKVFDPSSNGPQPRGKQMIDGGECFYTPSTGIWQTVWLEPVPASRINRLAMVPDIDNSCLKLKVEGIDAANCTVDCVARDGQTAVAQASGKSGEEIKLPIPKDKLKLWSPDTPFLYDLTVSLNRNGKVIDKVDSYFGMRKIGLDKDKDGFVRMQLNGKSVFQLGPLDQGFWPDGLYTAPTDEALRYDIAVTKKLGFNMIRKHIKVEPARWYYWCDKLGMLVWQDMPGGDNGTPEANQQFELELRRMVDGLFNSPSIIMWVVFNENYGQHDTPRYVELVRKLDSSRLVNNASGGVDNQVGDLTDIHEYQNERTPEPEANRASVWGEFGGLGMGVKGHTWSETVWTPYGAIADSKDLMNRYEKILKYLHEVARTSGLCGAVYTQTADVETECNGLMTYDREIIKFDEKRTATANDFHSPKE